MKTIFTLALLSILSIHVQAQDIAYYLNHPQISTTAKDYYNGTFWASDDVRTFSILDSLYTYNDSTRPFYFLLVSNMMHRSDGALSELVGVACRNLLESHPNEALEFLYANTALAKPEFRNDWAKAIAGEFMIACEGKEKPCIKNWFDKAMRKTDKENRNSLHDLLNKITSFINP